MSEFSQPHDDDVFASLAAQLEQDADFANRMEAVNGQIDDADLLRTNDEAASEVESRPYNTESITDVGEKIYAEFVAVCQEKGVDVNEVLESTDDYVDIYETICLLALHLKNRVWPGDIVAASGAIIVDTRGDSDDDMSVFSIGADEKIVGTFIGPVIGPMPDEAHVLAGDGNALPPIGVGIAIEDIAIIDQYGTSVKGEFSGAVIVALGTIGLTLERFNYRDQQ